MLKLNVGSGTDIKEGWVNLDMHNKSGADVIFDLNTIYSGEKMPFSDNHFDRVLCSHVLEDFIDPVPIMNELVRVANKEIIIRVPADTNLLMGNIRHKHMFTIFKLRSYASISKNYGEQNLLKIKSSRYYSGEPYRGLSGIYRRLCVGIRNALGYRLVESTFIKYLFPIADIEIIYMKSKIE